MYVDVWCEILHVTDSAVLVLPENADEEVWIPLSQIEGMTQSDALDLVDRPPVPLQIREWIALEKRHI